jgi:sugar lactone lactonase YvrE/thiol-disulfide isomerase/thioredoxin
VSPSLSLLAVLAVAPAAAPDAQEPSVSIRALLDKGHPRAPDLDRVGTWLGTDRPLLFRGALKGRVVLLDFWTSGCVNCLHALPVLHALEERFRGQPFQVVGIHSGKFDAEKEVSAVAEAMARHHIDHPVATDGDMVIWEQYAIHGWPTSVLVDARGYAVGWFRGEPELSTLTAWVQATLDDGRARGALASGPAEFKRPAVRDTGPLAFPGKVLGLAGGGLAVADSGYHRILLLDASGRLVRAVGSGLEGFSDGTPEAASFRYPQGLAERDGALYVADTGNHALRRVDLKTGGVETIAGTGKKAEGAVQPAADARTTTLRSPWDVVFVGDALWIAMAGSHQLFRLDVRSGALSAGAGSGREGLDDGPLAQATFAQPSGLATDGKVLYVADSEASAIRRVDPGAGTVKTLAGEGLFDFGLRDGALARARFQHPLGVLLAGGVLFVADTFNGALRRVSLADGQVSTVARGLGQPGGLTLAGGRLVVADTDHHRLVTVDPASGALSPLALTGVDPPAVRGLTERPVLATRALPLQHLEDATVASAGSELVLEVRLPEGHTFTAGAPQRVELTVAGASAPVKLDSAGAVLRARTRISPLRTPSEATFAVALYYCREGGTVCLVDRRRLSSRLVPADGGPEAATVHYRPTPPAPGS